MSQVALRYLPATGWQIGFADIRNVNLVFTKHNFILLFLHLSFNLVSRSGYQLYISGLADDSYLTEAINRLIIDTNILILVPDRW